MKMLTAVLCMSLMGGFAMAQALTEAHITEIMKEANEGEIDAAKLAQKEASNAQVKAFAKKMEKEHKKNEKEVKHISKKSKIGMDDNAAADQLETSNEQALKDLKTKKGAEFDKAYMQSQVDMHQSLLTKIESEFMPAATTPALKEYLTKTRDHVKMHLDEAKQIHSTL